MNRTANGLAKLDRMNKALRHQEPDRVPISDFFWGGFVERWRREFGLAEDADPYRYYNLDWQVAQPNLDPHIKPFEVLSENQEEVIVRTGFEAVIRKKFADPMPEWLGFDTDTIEKATAYEFEDPWDPRRYFCGGDNQMAGVGDRFRRDVPSWMDRVKTLWPDFLVYGSVCEANEYMTRIVGPENLLLWVGLYPEEFGRFVQRANGFALELIRAQIKAADGLLDGIVIWGDIAYKKDLFFSPRYWRQWYKPGLKAMVEEIHSHGLPVIYHGCGNIRRVFCDFVELGIDALNPLESKAGMDVVELRRDYGHSVAFCGNMDVILWSEASREQLEQVVLSKLNAAKGGGYVFQSDHSVPTNVPPASYDYVVELVRKHGRYPLRLGEYDLSEI